MTAPDDRDVLFGNVPVQPGVRIIIAVHERRFLHGTEIFSRLYVLRRLRNIYVRRKLGNEAEFLLRYPEPVLRPYQADPGLGNERICSEQSRLVRLVSPGPRFALCY